MQVTFGDEYYKHVATLARHIPEVADDMLISAAANMERCEGLSAASLRQRQEVLLLAHAQGSLAASIWLRISDPYEPYGELLPLVLDDAEPEALFAMGNIASRSTAVPDVLAPLVGSDVAAAAWQIVACRTGYACGQGSPLMDAFCADSGGCYFSDYEEFLLSQVEPEDAKELQARIDLIISLSRK